ncbi:hypothetical protein CEXT_669431 [Caerostris extrusa]|uniref:Uncharacterized protein n=1 Tax=Caerostris extrusa TaxID=172846 RepID=A0AAV4N7V8_CAEEX|nr:hypothetical protein CEXT_669431 [Caerostris extrusa]
MRVHPSSQDEVKVKWKMYGAKNEGKERTERHSDERSMADPLEKKREGIFRDGYSDKIIKTRRVSNHSLIAPSNEESDRLAGGC